MAQASQELVENRIQTALALVRANPAINKKQIAEALGLSATAIDSWVRRDTHNYNERYRQALKEAFDALEGKSIQCMSDLIDKGSFQASKYVLDNKGYAATQKIDANVNGDLTIDVSIEE